MSNNEKKYAGLEALQAFLNSCKNLFTTKEQLDTALSSLTTGDVVVKESEHSSTADNATNAENAENAKEAEHAVSADTATTAESATKATQDANGNIITDTYETKEDATAKLEEAKGYADQVKADILGGAPKETLDTIAELATAFEENAEVIEVLNQAITNKSNVGHTHSFEELDDKPFGEEPLAEILLNERTVEDSQTQIEELDGVAFFGNLMAFIYNKLIITFDNVKYELDAFEYDSRPNWGDSRLMGQDSNPVDVPFLLGTDWGTASGSLFGEEIPVWWVTLNDSIVGTPHTIKIEAITGETIKTLDEKYIPDTIARMSDLESIDIPTVDLSSYETKEDAKIKYDTIVEAKADWNQNDETAIDYVKNRTHWVEQTVEVMLEEQSVTTSESSYGDSSYYFANLELDSCPLSPDNNGGDEVIITVDGVSYNCTSWVEHGHDVNTIFIGDSRMWGEEGSQIYYSNQEDVPFLVELYFEGGGGWFGEDLTLSYASIYFYDSNSHTVKIEREIPDQTTYHTLDAKYIPDSIARTNNVITRIDPVVEGSFSLNRKQGSDIGYCSFSEGENTTASGSVSHAEGLYTTASGFHSHAEGYESVASGHTSHAEGYRTVASSDYQHVQGKCNAEDTTNTYAHIVGNGESSHARSNAHTLDWDGNAWYAGTIKVGGTSYDEGSEVALKSDLDDIDLSNYYTKEQIDAMELITVSDIDTICGGSIQYAEEVLF